MPQYSKVEYVGNETLTVHTAMLAILHNLMFDPHSLDAKVERRIRLRKIDFGLEDVTFLPYWKEQAGKRLNASSEHIKISIFEKPNGEFLAAVFNNSPTETEFQLDTPGVFKSATWYDPLTDASSDWSQSTSLKLKPYLGALLTIRR